MIFCKLKRPGRMQSPNFPPLTRPEVEERWKAILYPIFCSINFLMQHRLYNIVTVIVYRRRKAIFYCTCSRFLSCIPLILNPCFILRYVLYTLTRNRAWKEFLLELKEKFTVEAEKREMNKLWTLKGASIYENRICLKTWIRRRTKSIVRMNAGTGEKDAWKVLIRYIL